MISVVRFWRGIEARIRVTTSSGDAALSFDRDMKLEHHHSKRVAKELLYYQSKLSPLTGVILTLVISTAFWAISHYVQKSGANNSSGLRNTVVLIIRHAEKPDNGDGLSPTGEERARTYVNYFQNFTVDSKPLRLNYLFSAADSKQSRRPRLTLEPFSKTLGLPIDSRFKDKQFLELVQEIQNRPHGKNILICWHH